MAAALQYGRDPTPSIAMHSFFDITSATENGLTKHHEQKNSSTSDLNYDGPADNPFTRSRTGSRTVQLNSRPLTPLSNPQTNSNDTIKPLFNDASDIDIDPNSCRRKRQKTASPESKANLSKERDGTLMNESIEVEIYNSEGKANLEEKPTSILGNKPYPHPHIPTEQNPTTSEASSPKTPRRRVVRRTRESKADSGYDKSREYSEEDYQRSTPSRLRTSTPNQKTLSIHANGKLLSSPAAGAVSLGDVRTKLDAKRTSTRNYKMKNGKFVQSLEIVLRYGHDQSTRETVGKQINAIFTKQCNTLHTDTLSACSKTHPFFLGKVKPKLQVNEQPSGQGDTTENDTDSNPRQHEPIPWKDIKFRNQRAVMFKSAEHLRPALPPLSLQHVGYSSSDNVRVADGYQRKAKLKTRVVQLAENENLLHIFASNLSKNLAMVDAVAVPEKKCISGASVAAYLSTAANVSHNHDAIAAARSKLISGLSAFDRGECAGPNMWTMQFSPSCCTEILQPSALTLHHWLQNLAIHNVQKGVSATGNSKRSRTLLKKKQRKPRNELDDFIIRSDDEDEDGKPVKNAILITGPHGCGKTSSVFAVAKELGFEVFEIHPGMRRSAKDIFDKVGDMAHNHLVHNGPDKSRSSSVALSDNEAIEPDEDRTQTTVTGFLGKKDATKSKSRKPLLPQRAKKEQKQSLILFEEVDLLFEDDKGFWSGVQSLIAHAKRPVVLTCNNINSIPTDDLNLYDILHYEQVEDKLAVDYLTYIAAAEGHILDRESLSDLYISKGRDLRASITELNLWCQMTVGSQQGGLDWMHTDYSKSSLIDSKGDRLRIFSHNTFQKSLDLMPLSTVDTEVAIRFDQDTLGIASSDWCDFATSDVSLRSSERENRFQVLTQISNMTEARSVIDLLDDFAAPVLAAVTAGFCQSSNLPSRRDSVMTKYKQYSMSDTYPKRWLLEAMEPLMIEKPTFPPSQGRLAPSIDTAISSLATEVAPYVRCIVNYDRRMEQHRDDIFGSQGKVRNTRASRAAAEGGDKASTRSERWFPKTLDFEKVLRTGADWPEWSARAEDVSRAASIASP